jgi:nuclear pore complex protein Nup93
MLFMDLLEFYMQFIEWSFFTVLNFGQYLIGMCSRYKTYMTSVVMGNLQQACRGGVPGTFPLVRSYVAVRVPQGLVGLEDGVVEDQPFWPLVYYCLRCGDVAAALFCAKQAG